MHEVGVLINKLITSSFILFVQQFKYNVNDNRTGQQTKHGLALNTCKMLSKDHRILMAVLRVTLNGAIISEALQPSLDPLLVF